MPEQPEPPDQPDKSERPEPSETEWERRRRRAAIFGETLPDTTSDERDPGGEARGRESATDRWLKAQVPPHHGG